MSELSKNKSVWSARLLIFWSIIAFSVIFLTFISANNGRSDETNKDLVIVESLDTIKLCRLQECLKKGGFYQGSVDGISGPATLKAIEKYRSQYSLSSEKVSTDTIFEHILSNQSIPDKQLSSVIPKNGLIFHHPRSNAIAPLEIYTSDAGLHYFVKLTPPNSTRTILSIFIRSGQHIATKSPLGRYVIKYAVGETWNSKQCLFGKNTRFYKADRILDFKKVGNRVNGYRIELILQVHGNLPTKKIDFLDF